MLKGILQSALRVRAMLAVCSLALALAQAAEQVH